MSEQKGDKSGEIVPNAYRVSTGLLTNRYAGMFPVSLTGCYYSV